MADIPLKYALPILAIAVIPLGITVFSLLSTAPTVAATTKTKSPYWEGSRKADACLAAKDYYDTRAQKGHFETGDVGGLFTPNCTKVVFSGDHQEFASVVFEVRNGVERWNADVELKEISPGNWEYGGAIEVDHHIAVR